MTPHETCDTPFGSFVLERIPRDPTGTLRAWDGADLLLLEHVAELSPTPGTRVLLIGDAFGALSVALDHLDPLSLVDSIVAERAAELNRHANGRTASAHVRTLLDDLDEIDAVDLVLWKVDRVTEIVAETAAAIARCSSERTVVLAAGMDKHLPPRTGEILRGIGEVTTHPGRRKAHVFSVRPKPGTPRLHATVARPIATVAIEEHGLELANDPGVFSADHFDLGTRLLAREVAQLEASDDAPVAVVDLGCGSGALGIVALQAIRTAHVLFVDESARAIASTRRNVERNLGNDGLARSRFVQSDVFDAVGDLAADLILCNPPFHHANAVGDEVAWRMFQESRARLRIGGELWVVGNRHLGYHAKLKRLFGGVTQLAAHPKFVVLSATRLPPRTGVRPVFDAVE